MYLVINLDNDKIIYNANVYDISSEVDGIEKIEIDATLEQVLKVQIGKTKYINNNFDYTNNDEATYKANIRNYREKYCFDIVNRGQVWYDTLTNEQKEELKVWYQGWLDAPETLVIPEKPTWL